MTTIRLRALLCVTIVAGAAGCSLPIAVAGLRPEYPKATTGAPKVDSLRPEFRWEAFPRRADHERDEAGALERISDVSYDLRILRMEHPQDIAYYREALPAPRHELEQPLEPATEYQWSVRARFRLGGRTRVSAWGAASGWWRSATIPSPFPWRFRTPAAR